MIFFYPRDDTLKVSCWYIHWKCVKKGGSFIPYLEDVEGSWLETWRKWSSLMSWMILVDPKVLSWRFPGDIFFFCEVINNFGVNGQCPRWNVREMRERELILTDETHFAPTPNSPMQLLQFNRSKHGNAKPYVYFHCKLIIEPEFLGSSFIGRRMLEGPFIFSIVIFSSDSVSQRRSSRSGNLTHLLTYLLTKKFALAIWIN